MLTLLRFFIDLCLLRARPQDLPASPILLVLVAAIGISIGTPAAAPAFGSLLAGFGISLVDAAVLAGFIAVLLQFRKHPERFVQTATSALGANLVLSAIGLPLQWALPQDPETAGMFGQIASVIFQFIILWVVVVIGHVLRHALGISLLAGVGLAFGYAILSGLVILSLFAPAL